jgi:coenzyme F420-0:L-glutamate ligase/coenzyme F420-1:gamma-L-glutamate ligase
VTDLRHAYQELVAGRRSIRKYTGEPVSKAVLQRLLEAACRAPSAHNRQPWRFVVLQDKSLRRGLMEAMEESFRADLSRDSLSEDEIERAVSRGRQRMLGASAVVLLFLTMEDMDRYPDGNRQSAEHTMAVQSVALAGGQLLMAAHAEGLGACWVCSPLFASAIVRQTLDLPAAWEAQGMITLGYPDGPGKARSRKDLDEVVQWR